MFCKWFIISVKSIAMMVSSPSMLIVMSRSVLNWNWLYILGLVSLVPSLHIFSSSGLLCVLSTIFSHCVLSVGDGFPFTVHIILYLLFVSRLINASSSCDNTSNLNGHSVLSIVFEKDLVAPCSGSILMLYVPGPFP